MNDMFTFERPDWELLLDSLRPANQLSAVLLLSVLEPEDEQSVEDALESMTQRQITLDVSSLPMDFGAGEMEKRLRFEDALPRNEKMLLALEDGDPLRLYLEELAATPAQGDTNILSQRLLKGDEAASQLLLNLHLHRAVEIAREFTGRGVLLLDLIQEAGLGLWQGILQYDGGDFESHIDWWIRQGIARVVFLQARESGVLRNMQSNMEAYRQADKRLLTELGRNATMEELAMELGITPEQADVIRDMILNASAMEKMKQKPEEATAEDEQAVEDTAYFQSRQRVTEMLSALSQQEAQIIALRFGLEGGAPMTAEAVAEKLGMSAEQVVAAEAAALEKLRNE